MTLPAFLRPVRDSVAAPLAVAVVLVLAAAATAQTSSPGSSPPGSVRIEPLDGNFVTAGRTNVRQQPSAQSPRVGRLESGATVRVTGKVAGASWYAVIQDDGKPGFVAAEQLRSVAPAAPAPVPTPAPAAAPAPPADAALREQLSKIESSLADINRQMPNLKELEALSGTVKGLVEREEKRLAEAAAEPKPTPAPEESPTLTERLSALQDQVAEQLREQRTEFSRLGDRLSSVELSIQPLVDWAKSWTSMAAPAAEEAQGWLSSSYTAVRDWVVSWIPWWKPAPQPYPQPPRARANSGST